MKIFSIIGKVKYFNLETGFWGIIDEKGKEWLPLNLPEQLKYEGRQIKIKAKEVNADSMFMWGTPIKIVSFQTVTP